LTSKTTILAFIKKVYQGIFRSGAAWLPILLCLMMVDTVSARGNKCEHPSDINKTCLNENSPYITKEFTVKENSKLKAFTIAGNIQVQTVDNSDRVRVELYLDRGYSFWSNSKNLDNYRITIMQRGKDVIASVERKSKETGFFSDHMRFSYKIYVPRKISTELKTAGGNVLISGMEGHHIIKSSGGDIELDAISGKASAYTAGGDINIRNSKGILFGKTIGGNITIDQSKGEMRMQSNAGQVIAERISGTLLVQLGAGDIKAHFLEVSEGISLDTKAGNIRLELPAMEGYDLVLHGSNIELPSNLEFSGYKSISRVEGSVSGGGIPINLSTSHGNIVLKNQ
jgi:DUF4097 and DUF4098 domain-containing protein YvlB